MSAKTYRCEKCGTSDTIAYQDKYFMTRFGKVCLWCADLTIDTTRYMGWTQMADAEMGDL